LPFSEDRTWVFEEQLEHELFRSSSNA